MDNSNFVRIIVKKGMLVRFLTKHFWYYPELSLENLNGMYSIGEACTAFVKDAEMYITPNSIEAINKLEREGFQHKAFTVPPLYINPFAPRPEAILIDPLAIKDCQAI